ncbi:hypothetical protein [Corynebacterium aquatimens]|uniref:PBP1b-binding outer membrane lipoprotein LpoB n=1 Tax=Corynebacterium aquatimens TaxID=1190508 RepID=A0A931GSR5_9CORY|nr:hypothetical protein [Corynebacterium aquatimens]MBG6122307.1 PBP1b-binding outer membrane lipoprotein LpoB [Corynebacterium aquatimens]WJY65151.1 hypothetical protein CAQUA_02095 [Corynebacterium aquatimens]
MTYITRNKIRPAVASVIAASALVLSGCEFSIGGNTSEESAEEKTAEKKDDSDADKDSDSDSDKDSDSDSEGGKPSDFAAAKEGDRFKLGDTADIIIPTINDDVPVYAEATVEKMDPITVEDAEKNAGGVLADKDKIKSLTCFEVSYKIVDSEATEGTLSAPSLTPVMGNGNRANSMISDQDDICGIHKADRLPLSAKDIEVGKTYKAAAVTVETTDASGPQMVATGMKMRLGTTNTKHPSGEIYFDGE